MKKSFSQLKKDLVVGRKIKCIEYNTRYDGYPKNVGRTSDIIEKSELGVKILHDGVDTWLFYPCSEKLVEYENNIFKFYIAGYRDLTQEEKEHINNMNIIINKSNSKPSFIKEEYCKWYNCEYLTGYKAADGKSLDVSRYNRGMPCIADVAIKGELFCTFVIVE